MLRPYERQALVFLTIAPRMVGDPAWDPHFAVLVRDGLAVIRDGTYHITASGHKELERTDVVTGEPIPPGGTASLEARRGWRAQVLNAAFDVAQKQERLTIVDIRAEASGAGDPHHPNAWGAILGLAQKQGWVEPLEEWTKCKGHAKSRQVRVWRSKIFRRK